MTIENRFDLDLVRSIGADRALDYTREDFARNGPQYDLVFGAVAKLSFSDCRGVLKTRGIYVTTEFTPDLARWYRLGEVPEALRYLGNRHARGKVVNSVRDE